MVCPDLLLLTILISVPPKHTDDHDDDNGDASALGSLVGPLQYGSNYSHAATQCNDTTLGGNVTAMLALHEKSGSGDNHKAVDCQELIMVGNAVYRDRSNFPYKSCNTYL